MNSIDLVRKLSENNIRVSSSKVTEAIKLHLGLETTNSSYSKYHVSILPTTQKPWVEETKHKGRHYTFTRESMEKNS